MRWIGISLAVAFVAVLTAPLHAAIALDAAIPLAAGTTVLTGEWSAQVVIRVPTDAVLDLTPVRTGDGSATRPSALREKPPNAGGGFVLIERGTTDGLVVFAMHLDGPLHAPLVDGDMTHAAVGHGRRHSAERSTLMLDPSEFDTACKRCRVPAGDYDLHMVSGVGSAAVVVSFDGLSGSVEIPGRSPE